MGKYEPLARYLDSQKGGSWQARFNDIERVLGFALPRRAHEYPAWWANQDGSHSQTKGWRDAGWETRKVDLGGKTVVFERSRRRPHAQASASSAKAELLKSARDLTGVQDESELIQLALQRLIQSEVAKGLINLGGSDPEASAPPRRSISW